MLLLAIFLSFGLQLRLSLMLRLSQLLRLSLLLRPRLRRNGCASIHQLALPCLLYTQGRRNVDKEEVSANATS